MKRIACLILFVIGAAVCYGQHRVTLEECQLLARDNYPVIAQQELIDQLEEFNISNARRNWLPKISLSAMAAYLSEVPEFPSTLNDLFSQLGVNLAAMPNTLYGTTVQIQQAIWDGGLIKAQTEAAKAESEVSRRSWESEMYALTERVNQLYFGSLLLQENIATADLMIEDLQRNYKMLESMAAFGTAATIRSRSYETVLRKLVPGVEITARPCPLFVPLVEAGYVDHSALDKQQVTRLVIAQYLAEVREAGVDTLILGCTHYPLIKEMIGWYMGRNVTLVDPAQTAAHHLERTLSEHGLKGNHEKGEAHFYVSDVPDSFAQTADLFLGEYKGGLIDQIAIDKY